MLWKKKKKLFCMTGPLAHPNIYLHSYTPTKFSLPSIKYVLPLLKPILKLPLWVTKDGGFVAWVQAESKSGTNESILKVALDHGKAFGIIKPHDRVVVCQKVGDSSVVKIIELEDWLELAHHLISRMHNENLFRTFSV